MSRLTPSRYSRSNMDLHTDWKHWNVFCNCLQSAQRLWTDTDIRKHRVWNSKVSNPSGLKLLELFVCSKFEMSALQCSTTHCTYDGRGDVLDIVHQNVLLSEVIVTDILDSNDLSVLFKNILGAVSEPRFWTHISIYPNSLLEWSW
jgi:hypothetical protein